MPHAPTTLAAPPPTTSAPRATRWRFLDSLRGFALLGILLVNALDITRVGDDALLASRDGVHDPVREALYLTVQTRFVPIFVLLFGMSLWFVLSGARARVGSGGAWLVLVRRLVTIGLVGAALMLVYPGNILIEYGVVGLLVLPCVALLPRWAVLALGVLGTGAAYVVFGGGLAATPGLMLLGAGGAAHGLPRVLETRTRVVAVAFAVAAVLTVPAVAWQLTQPGDPRFTTAGATAGLAMAAMWTTGLALLWRTPLRRGIVAFFEPLGRMALSNYVGAAVVLFAAGLVVDFPAAATVTPVVLLCVPLVVAQCLLSAWWLRRFAYGPVEWLVRCATWWRPVGLRRRPVPVAA